MNKGKLVPADGVAEQIGLLWDYRINRGYPFLSNAEDVPLMRALLAGERLQDQPGFEWLGSALREAEVVTAVTPARMPTRRLRACVEAWPECEEGEYNPSCCRFPKSCSATVYDPSRVKESDLEVVEGD